MQKAKFNYHINFHNFGPKLTNWVFLESGGTGGSEFLIWANLANFAIKSYVAHSQIFLLLRERSFLNVFQKFLFWAFSNAKRHIIAVLHHARSKFGKKWPPYPYNTYLGILWGFLGYFWSNLDLQLANWKLFYPRKRVSKNVFIIEHIFENQNTLTKNNE